MQSQVQAQGKDQQSEKEPKERLAFHGYSDRDLLRIGSTAVLRILNPLLRMARRIDLTVRVLPRNGIQDILA